MRFVFFILLFSLVAVAETPGLAVLNFETRGDIPAEVGVLLAETVYSKFSPKEFRLIEKSQLKKSLGERFFHLGADKDLEELISAGAEFAMLGFIEKRDGKYYGGWRLLDIKTGEIQQEKKYIQGAKSCEEFVDILGRSLLYLSNKSVHAEIEDVAEEIAGYFGEKIKQMPVISQPYRIAIFPFGNKKGEAGSAMGNLPTILQAEIIRQLQFYLNWQAPKRFEVMDVDHLKNCFRRRSLEPLGINLKYLDQSLRILSKAEIDVAILGRYEIERPYRISKESLAIHATGITLPGKFVWTIKSYISKNILEEHRAMQQSMPSGRFSIRIFIKAKEDSLDSDENAWEERPLYRFKEQDSSFYNARCIVLKERDLEKRYKIVIKNSGTPAVTNPPHPLDKDRLFSVSLLIDGIDTFYHKKGEDIIACAVHPRKAQKRILTAPGRRLVPDIKGTTRILKEEKGEWSTLIQGARLEDVPEKGDSELQILGFQNNSDKIDNFIFYHPKEALAEEVGITQTRGIISAYFYAEKLPQSNQEKDSKGMEVHIPSFPLSFQIHKKPCEVISIFYRYEEDLSFSMDDLELCK